MTDVDMAVVRCHVEIACSIDLAWQEIGLFEGAGRFLDVPCKLTYGDGGTGSVRQIGDSILETMVGSSRHSYTYAQTIGPMAAFGYHGCVSLEATGPDACALHYTLVYNQQHMDEQKRLSEFMRLSARFTGAAEAMKRVAELRTSKT